MVVAKTKAAPKKVLKKATKVSPKKTSKAAVAVPAKKETPKKAAPKKTAKPTAAPKKTSKASAPAAADTKKPAKVVTKASAPSTVSRRPIADKPGKKKGKLVRKSGSKGKEVAQVSEVVSNVQLLIQRLSAAERVYYDEVRALKAESTTDEVRRLYQIGALLLKCKQEFPKSDATETITAACGISDSHGRLYRKIAERFKPEEIESYAAMENKITGWRIPITTFYCIGQRAETPQQRKAYVKVVIDEQMSQETFDQRFPQGVDVDGKAVAVRVIKALSVIKRGKSTIAKTQLALHDLQEDAIKKDMREADITTRTLARTLLEDIQEFKSDLSNAEYVLEGMFEEDNTEDETSINVVIATKGKAASKSAKPKVLKKVKRAKPADDDEDNDLVPTGVYDDSDMAEEPIQDDGDDA